MFLNSTVKYSLLFVFVLFTSVHITHADTLTLTSGSNATTTPNVATSIPGFQIVGPSSQTTPVKLRATSGTLNLSTISGVTMSGNNSSTVNLSGTVEKLNMALSTLTYTRGSTGTDTLEVSLVESGEVFFTDNGHLYKFISSTGTWTAAKTAAEAQTAYGATGYLATVTSSSENDFISARLVADGWFGASDASSEGVWKWVTGPETDTTFWNGASGGSVVSGLYANWNSGEPNNSGNEDCAQYYSASGKWNDLPCTGTTLSGYVVEFGADGNLPTVVAQNISIVTADVPALTSLSPSNGATSVSPTANLVIGFSKNVTAQTGNILIKKISDDSTAETINVAGDLISGSGTNSITINPSVTLDEGTNYYVVVPQTAFKDSSNNFYDGFTASTTWAFTTSDVTAPVISNIATSTATTTASIAWDTNEDASTKVVYSTGTSYASTTSESDISPRVTSHTKELTGLSGCTTYNFKVVSTDGFTNTATSTSYLFTTLGCPAYSVPMSATTTSVTVSSAATSTLTENGRSLSVATPANFTATSSTVVIQIRSMNAEPVLTSLSVPANVLQASDVVFDVTALINSEIVLDSFDAPVTITYQYTDEDIDGLDENSLWMYHYHDDEWDRLDSCVVDTGANIITCNTPSFSIFGIFGTPPVVVSNRASSGSSVQTRVANLIAMGNYAGAENLKKEWPLVFSSNLSTPITNKISIRDLEMGMKGDDVKALQQLLIAQGYSIPAGATGYFGPQTKAALSSYQSKNSITPSVGYFGSKTRLKLKASQLSGLWW